MARLVVRVQPGARRSGFVGWFGDHPKLAVAAPPVDGAANDEARRVIAACLGVHRRQVRLVIGAASRTKHFEVEGIDAGAIRARIDEVLAGR
jgi:uncharacterized protein YggU (UPF0235/DUF167 family)